MRDFFGFLSHFLPKVTRSMLQWQKKGVFCHYFMSPQVPVLPGDTASSVPRPHTRENLIWAVGGFDR